MDFRELKDKAITEVAEELVRSKSDVQTIVGLYNEKLSNEMENFGKGMLEELDAAEEDSQDGPEVSSPEDPEPTPEDPEGSTDPTTEVVLGEN